MSAAALKLECFTRPVPETDPPLQDEGDPGYDQGYADGYQAARNRMADELAQQLAEFGTKIEAERRDDLNRRQEILASVIPLVSGIVDLIGPAGARDQLDALLVRELTRLVESAPLKRCTIRCHSTFEEAVLGHAAHYDSKLIRVDSSPDFEGVELSVDGGIIIFDPRFVTTKIKSLIDNLLTGEAP